MGETLAELFKNKHVLVIGDAMIDCYLTGKVERISPEAPVPILEVKKREYRLGGSANVALNLESLGATPILCSVIGDDDKAHIFMELMKMHELNSVGIINAFQRKTTIKYRVIGNKNQMIRIDDEDNQMLPEDEQHRLVEKVKEIVEELPIEAIIIEDYDKGMLNKEVLEKIIAIGKAKNLFIAVDPKKRNFHHYSGVDLFKPNLSELKSGLNMERDITFEELEDVSRRFAEMHQIKMVMTTLSEHGISIYNREDNSFFHLPSFVRDISDVSGAGDTVISVATLLFLNHKDTETTARIANLAGGIVCEYAGVVPIPLERLELETKKSK